MKILDKLKNALFEEEEIDVPEKEENPKRFRDNIDRIKEEFRVKDVKVTTYDAMDDEDDAPVAKKIIATDEETKEDFTFPAVDDNFFDDVKVSSNDIEFEDSSPINEKVNEDVETEEIHEEKPLYNASKNEDINLYQTNKEVEYVKQYTNSEYGTYPKSREKKSFRPSPNISPVYGIIDDPVPSKKEEVKREVRLTSAIKNSNIDIDEVRNKALGVSKGQEHEEVQENSFIDLTSNNAPEVNKVTVGDAEEYFEDLGLEYNNDYLDANKNNATRRVKINDSYENADNVDDNSSSSMDEDEELPSFLNDNQDDFEENYKDDVNVSETSLNEEVDDANKDDDNLFDLIDSMYDK